MYRMLKSSSSLWVIWWPLSLKAEMADLLLLQTPLREIPITNNHISVHITTLSNPQALWHQYVNSISISFYDTACYTSTHISTHYQSHAMLMMPLWPQGLKEPFKSVHTKGRGGRELEQIAQKYFIPRVSNHTTAKRAAEKHQAALMHTVNYPEKS